MVNSVCSILSDDADWFLDTPFQTFGMPIQGSLGIGSGNCGVGVVLAAWYFINNPL